MPNSIALIQKYIDKLDDVYKVASLTSDLEANPATVRMGNNAREILVAKMDMDGLGDYSRNGGYADGFVNLEWESKEFNYDRGRRLTVDTMDNEETAHMSFGLLAGEFIRTKVAPEMDAWRFAKYAKLAGTTVSTDFDTIEDFCIAINEATTTMDEAEVPAEGRLLYTTPTLHNALTTLDSYKSKEMFGRFSKVVRVPQSRFYSAVDLMDGKKDDELTGGYRKNENGKKLNFMIIHPKSVIQFTKHRVNKTITPEANQTADAWMYFYRAYGITEAYDNKRMGIYASISTK